MAALPLLAQWSGSADVSAGLGGMTGDKQTRIGYLGHALTQGSVNLRYKTDKFSWSTTVNGRWEPKSTDNTRLNMIPDQRDKVDLELVYKTVKTRPLQLGLRSEFDWKPSAERNYSAWISYQYKNDRARNVSNSLSGKLNLEGLERSRRFRLAPDGRCLRQARKRLDNRRGCQIPEQSGHVLHQFQRILGTGCAYSEAIQ